MTEPPAEGLAEVVIVYWFEVNVAVTPEFCVMVNMQLPVPVQLDAEPVPFDQPVKVEPVLAVALKIILVPWSAVHVPVLPFQFKVHPLAFTVPEPVPVLVTVKVYWFSVNLASAVFSISRLLNVHVAWVVPLPETMPEQVVHATVEPVEAVALNRTSVPWSKLALTEVFSG